MLIFFILISSLISTFAGNYRSCHSAVHVFGSVLCGAKPNHLGAAFAFALANFWGFSGRAHTKCARGGILVASWALRKQTFSSHCITHYALMPPGTAGQAGTGDPVRLCVVLRLMTAVSESVQIKPS